MNDINIPKDFRSYESKLFMGITTRQFVVMTPAILFGLTLNSKLPEIIAMPIMILLLSLGVCLGWLKPYGLKFEVFVATSFVKMYLSPTKRVYKSHNLYGEIVSKQAAKKKIIKKNKLRRKRDESKKEEN